MGNAWRKPPVTVDADTGTDDAEDVCLDPRSPTPDVIRTPISGKEDIKHKITKNADLSKKLNDPIMEEKLVHNNPILSAVIRKHYQSYDPRSPSQEFDRTPVIISENKEETNNHDINHNGSLVFLEEDLSSLDPEVICGNSNRNLHQEYLDASLLEDCTFNDSELLVSSTASQDVIENEVSPPAKVLLETDFDYIPLKVSEESVQKEDEFEGKEKPSIISKFKIIDDDPRSPSQGIDRTPIVVHQNDESCDDNVENMSEDSLVAALQSGIIDLRTPILGTNKALLIYEDAVSEFTPRKTNSDNKGSRTPLSCVKNKTEERTKSSSNTNDKKKVSRIPKRISSLQKNSSFQISKPELNRSGGTAENTPPVKKGDVWDKNGSVIL